MTIEPIPYFYDPINRNAIIVRPKKPFFDWINIVFSDDEPILKVEENNIYLIRAMHNNEEIKKWIKKNYDDLFTNELNDWSIDEDTWPINRSYKLFMDWFDIEICSMILDIEDIPVTKG
jgi:hypothetical protein